MNAPVEDEKIIGISKGKYLKVTYTLLLISSVFGVLSSLLGLLGMTVPLSTLASLLGLVGVVLALLGLFVFSEKFSAIEVTHFKYMGFLFLAFIVVGIVIGVTLGGAGMLFSLIGIILNAVALTAMYAGFRLFEKNTEATKDNVINEIKSFKSGLRSS